MNISDEKLSAFLDAELPESEMETIRRQLADDEALANRLADLAMVDELMTKTYSAIDTKAVPDAITALLAEDKPQTAQVIAFPLWKRFHQGLQRHAAIAASVALVLGFGLAQLKSSTVQNNGEWQQVAQTLENIPSSIDVAMGDTHVTPRTTFINQQGEYCRQFLLSNKKSTSENIACRQGEKWQLAATVYLDHTRSVDDYKTASGGSVLDSAIDHMTNGDFFDANAESIAIDTHWAPKKK